MKYYPEYSENYQYFEAVVDVTRMKIDEMKTKYDEKEQEIHQFVKDNQGIINSIKDDSPALYNSWITEYKELR